MSSKNADVIHETQKDDGATKGSDNSISNVFVIVVYVLFFVLVVYAAYMVTASYAILVMGVLLLLLMLYVETKQLYRPDSPKKHKAPDNKMMCKNGHIVSVYINYDGGITKGQHNLDVTCGASVWPKECPICGSSWLRPGK